MLTYKRLDAILKFLNNVNLEPINVYISKDDLPKLENMSVLCNSGVPWDTNLIGFMCCIPVMTSRNVNKGNFIVTVSKIRYASPRSPGVQNFGKV